MNGKGGSHALLQKTLTVAQTVHFVSPCQKATVTTACGSTTSKYDCEFLRIANNNIFKMRI